MKKKTINNKDIKRFNAAPNEGLDEAAVEYMKSVGKVNIAQSPTNKSYGQIIFGNIFTFFNILMFIVAGLLLAIVGPKVVTNLMFLIIIICNLLIGTIQECKSKRTIEKLKLLSDSRIQIKRNGNDLYLLPSEIVLDDVVILNPGDQIPADCEILGDEIIEVNESLLTGESVPVKKSKGEMVYAGSFVVSGSIAVRVDKVGNDTYVQSIENKAKVSKQPKSRLMLAINKIIKTMAFIALPLAVVVFINEMLHTMTNNTDALPTLPSYWGQESIASDAVFYSGVTVAYMIPCGMALLASVAMATGVVRLAQEKTLAQNLYSVESLSRVNTLCLDKTGTLTDGTMTLEKTIVLDEKYEGAPLNKLISSYLSAFSTANQTSTALLNKYSHLAPGAYYSDRQTSDILGDAFYDKERLNIINHINFSSARKYSAVEFERLGWFVLGAPEYITKDPKILEQVGEYAKHGLRVILFSKVIGIVKDDAPLPGSMNHVAMFVISDTIRPEVKDTMLWFRENDVDIKVISGDNIGTVSYIAKQSGIENWDKCFDMSTFKEGDNLEEIVLNNAIFGRVTPDQKADIVAILKKNNRVVGVTGDGLNDLLAFKQADCSIALANGAAATKNVANLVLLDSNFANMKEAVFQGRRVVNNIQRSSSLFVMKDFLWLFITILPILLGIPHMIQPTVMSVVNIFITGIASVFVALEPDKTRVTGNFYKNVTKRAILSGFYMFIPVLLITLYVIFTRLFTSSSPDFAILKDAFVTKFDSGEIVSFGWIPTMALCVTIGGFIIFFNNCRPFTKFRKVLYAATLFVVLVILFLAPEYFIISGTDMLKETGGVMNIFPYVFSHIVKNATLGLFRTMTLEQVIFVAAYAVIAYPIYILNDKALGKLLDLTLFSPREFKDE